MKELNSVIFKSLQTVIVKFSGRLSGLLLSIFLARMLGAEDLGIINFINQFLAIILVISMLGIRMVLIKKISIYNSDGKNKEISNIIKISYLINGLSGLFLATFIFYYSQNISNFFFQNETLGEVLSIFLVAFVPQIFTRIHSYALLGINKVWQSNLAEDTLSSIISFLILFVFYLINYKIDILTVALTFVISRILLSIGLYIYWKNQGFSNNYFGGIKIKFLRKLIPFFLISVVGMVQARFDILIVGYFLESSAIAIYTVAITIALIPSFALNIIESASLPTISKLYYKNEFDKMENLVKKLSMLLLILGLISLIIFILFGNEILLIWGKEFVYGYSALVVLSFGQIFNMFSGVSASLLMLTGFENLRKNLAFITLFLQIFISIYFIKFYGILGAAISSSFISFVLNLSLFILVKKELKFFPITLKINTLWK